MKTKLTTFLLLTIISFANAQEDVCAAKEKQFRDYVTSKDFSNANLSWLDVREKCAKYSEDIYKLGNEILNYNIEIAPADKKEEAVRELLKMFKKYDTAFPNNTNSNSVKSAMALFSNNIGTTDEIYSLLDYSFKKQPDSFKDAQAIAIYFRMFFDKYKEGKSSISPEDVIEKYSTVSSLVFENTKKYPELSAEYGRVNMSNKALVYDLLICDNLTPYFEKSYEKNKDNASWLNAAALTFSEKCKTSKTFETIALQLNTISPTSASAYFLGDYYLNTRDQVKALNYFETSVQLASGIDKAIKAYTIASIVSNSDKAKSKEMVEIAMQNDPSNGKYYLFLANLYANSLNDCATTPETQSAIYQLASDVVVKAGKIEQRLKSTADKYAAEYLKKVDRKYKGKSVKINCFINETVRL